MIQGEQQERLVDIKITKFYAGKVLPPERFKILRKFRNDCVSL
jgi:hypothetical protein